MFKNKMRLLPITIMIIIKCFSQGYYGHALSDSATPTTRGISAQTTPKTKTTTTTATTNDSIAQVESIMQMLHDTEIAGGKDSFSKKSNNNNDNDNDDDDDDVYYNWSDDDFISHNIGGGDGNAGTDATYIQNSDQMFESQNPILSEEECVDIIQEARETIAQGLLKEEEESQQNNNSEQGQQQQQQRASSISNSQLGEARLSNMPKTRAWLQDTLQSRFFPLLKSRFGVDDLVLYDGLVLGNQAPSRSQPIHRDASLLTLNVALSKLEDFEGGGTYIEVLDDTLKINQGHLLCHAGSVMHAGVGINKGERWVFVLFVLGESQPQFSRRCHAQALECIQDRQLKQAEEVLQTGLRVATNDHLLHNTMGRLHLMRQEPKMAIKSFQSADNAYPVCQKAMVSIAQILIESRRPRAALRRLNLVLERINNRDLKPDSQMSLKGLAFGARRDAARCALLCAEYNNAKRQQQQQNDDDPMMMEWNRLHLAVAIDRMKTCLNAAPNEPNLLGMLDRAEFLFKEAQQ